MKYTTKIAKMLNTIWQQCRPFAEMVDNGEHIGDTEVKQMIKAAENFKYEHKEFASAAIRPQPGEDICNALDGRIYGTILNLMGVVEAYAQLEGLTMPKQTADPLEGQTSMLDER